MTAGRGGCTTCGCGQSGGGGAGGGAAYGGGGSGGTAADGAPNEVAARHARAADPAAVLSVAGRASQAAGMRGPHSVAEAVAGRTPQVVVSVMSVAGCGPRRLADA